MRNVPEKVQKAIKKAEENGSKTLNLSINGLTEILEFITKLTNLKELYLKGNQLTEIPLISFWMKFEKLIGS